MTRVKEGSLRILPWVIGAALGIAIIHLQLSGRVPSGIEAVVQIPRTLPAGYRGRIGVRAFVTEGIDRSDPQLLAVPGTLELAGTEFAVGPSQAEGLEATVELPDTFTTDLPFRFVAEARGKALVVEGTISAVSPHEFAPGVEVRTVEDTEWGKKRCSWTTGLPHKEHCTKDAHRFMARHGGCLAGHSCANLYEKKQGQPADSTPSFERWPPERWKELKQLAVLPRYAIAINSVGSDEQGNRTIQIQPAEGAIAVDTFCDGVWCHAASAAEGTQAVPVPEVDPQTSETQLQLRPNAFGQASASSAVWTRDETSFMKLAELESRIVQLPKPWSWRTQQQARAEGKQRRAQWALGIVGLVCALASILLLAIRWRQHRLTEHGFSDDESQALRQGQRVRGIVLGAAALLSLFVLGASLFLLQSLWLP